jgi:hypothetical protein
MERLNLRYLRTIRNPRFPCHYLVIFILMKAAMLPPQNE